MEHIQYIKRSLLDSLHLFSIKKLNSKNKKKLYSIVIHVFRRLTFQINIYLTNLEDNPSKNEYEILNYFFIGNRCCKFMTSWRFPFQFLFQFLKMYWLELLYYKNTFNDKLYLFLHFFTNLFSKNFEKVLWVQFVCRLVCLPVTLYFVRIIA